MVMPNHVHGLIFIQENDRVSKNSLPSVWAQHAAPIHAPIPAPIPASLRGMTPNIKPGSLGAIVRSFKSAVTRRAELELNTGNIWQRNYYEHILRDRADYERIAGYILDNPANWDQDGENPQNLAGPFSFPQFPS